MRSAIVVISWWSNTLGLECLHRLAKQAPDRAIHVVQVGKSPEGRARFRRFLPSSIIELDYPEDAPAEHSRVIRSVALERLARQAGIWFVDHDVFVEEACTPWLSAADAWFEQSDVCLCVHSTPESPSITQPAFWMSSSRWPADIADVDPVPFEARDEARRPDLYRNDGRLQMPVKDTLVLAREKLSALGQAGVFHLSGEPPTALPPFPRHTHLGGLSLFSGPVGLPILRDWARATVARFDQFFQGSPWFEVEDPELLRRFGEFKQWLRKENPVHDDSSTYEQFPYSTLKILCDRREFWSTLKTGYDVKLGESQGGTAWTLANLGDWPDERLAEITPMVISGCKIIVRDGYVWGVPPSAVSQRRLFSLDSPALLVFNRFNGMNLLAEVVADLAAEVGWDPVRAFAYTRGLFLSLVTAGICRPKY